MASSPNGYGTVPHLSSNQNGTIHPPGQHESEPLLSNKSGRVGLFTRVHNHFAANVEKDWGDLALLVCYIITGLLDSSSTLIWGSFVSMQTGNTIYLGLGIAAPNESNRWIRSGISILSFCLGSAFFAVYHRALGQKRRWSMVSSYLLQALLIVGAALMVTLGPETTTSGPVTVWIVVPIALIAFQSAGQAFVSRAIEYGSLTTVVLTSIYCDLFSDQNFFAAPTRNVERNRRAAAPVFLVTGAALGGIYAHSEIGIAGALWTAAALKLIIVFTWMFWPAEKESQF